MFLVSPCVVAPSFSPMRSSAKRIWTGCRLNLHIQSSGDMTSLGEELTRLKSMIRTGFTWWNQHPFVHDQRKPSSWRTSTCLRHGTHEWIPLHLSTQILSHDHKTWRGAGQVLTSTATLWPHLVMGLMMMHELYTQGWLESSPAEI